MLGGREDCGGGGGERLNCANTRPGGCGLSRRRTQKPFSLMVEGSRFEKAG